MSAKQRYDYLSSDRSQFLTEAEDATKLTLPYLIRGHEESKRGMKQLKTPWQSVGAKGVVALASKLSLALVPPQSSFFKLQLDESQLGEQFPPEVRSELDLSFAKIERTILDAIAASDDRVVIHQALQHLVVGGNALIFMGKPGLKLFPLNRFVIERDGNGDVIEIITKETINKKLIEKQLPPELEDYESVVDEGDGDIGKEECDVYTWVTRENNRFVWHQEVYGNMLQGSISKAPVDSTPWLPLRFNSVDGEAYGRGRVGQFIGDLKSLEALSQALVEGSAAAAKVVFVVSPSSTTKPQTLASAGNGAIVQGRPDDIGVVQVGKTADFQTAYQLMGQLEKRLNEAFLILSVRESERTTAQEVQMTQMELEQQLGGLFGLLTVEFLVPYLNRKLTVFQKTGEIPRIPKGMVKPIIVAGINALGRGQDVQALGQFLTTISQTMGPEAIAKYINPEEVVKRLAAAQGIDVLNLVRGMEEVQQEEQQAQQQAMEMERMKQTPNLLKAPVMDPSKNPQLAKEIEASGGMEAEGQPQGGPPPEDDFPVEQLT
tara:strand:- start:1110 stop:2750 length:1641 start_codon:yes stop_codon:yes gene_type:complete